MEARREAREENKKWVLLEEITWRQKSREVWLKEGDRNTGIFHKMANAHRRRNNVDQIRINGIWHSEENGINEAIINAFRTLLSNPGDWRPPLSRLQCETLENMDACVLEVQFTEEEVYDVLLGCNGDKASGLDGFSMAFWQFAWDFVKDDVMNFFREFYDHNKFVKSLNATFRDFRLISLVGSHKWLAKVLANRLKRWFLRPKGLLWRNNENGILCKLDIEKAYDNVDWSFLLIVIPKMGFGEKLIGWIKWCISTASFSVLVNDTSTDFFQSSRGLRQGDPLSPYLFVIDMEVFSLFLKRAVDEASQDNLTYLSWLLMWFEAVSGLRINLEKSELIPVGRVENIDDLALDFGCRVGSLPSTYLGLPLGAPFKSVSVWDGVEERFRRRLFLNGIGVLQMKEALWNQVIRGKYGEDRGGWCSREVREAHGVGLWKGIRMDWELVGARISFRVGSSGGGYLGPLGGGGLGGLESPFFKSPK
ncbi:hypothetical protein AAG906_018961 [Vitis piasezkii]